MGEFKDVNEAREFFFDDTFARKSGIVIDELTDNGCVCSMEICDDHKNAAGGVMGGAIFTLADFAFAVASNNMHKVTLVQNVSINFLSGTRGTRLIATATCKKDGKNICVYNVDVTDDLGRDVAQYVGTGYKL